MSLLMDALRRAEEAKRLATTTEQTNVQTVGTAGELTLDPLDSPGKTTESALPPLGRHREAIDADLAASAGNAPPRRRSLARDHAPAEEAAREAERNALRNVFAVKQEAQPKTGLWVFIGAASVATLAIAGYFWWQLQSVGSSALALPQPPASVSPPVLPQTSAATQRAMPPLTPSVQPGDVPVAATTTPLREPPRSAPSVPEVASVGAAERLPRPAAHPSRMADPALVRLTSNRAKAEETVQLAYDALQANRLEDARRAYEQVLNNDPHHVDALLGLATIAVRQGYNERAQQLYLRALEANPADVTAQAGLINLRGPGDATHAESRLKTLLAGQPQSPGLNFALGNVYARQGRWSEAQQAYFQAYALEPENPDYLYNIAVSLDHLRQSKLAIQYYRMALVAAETRRGAFDENAVGKRLLELQR